MSETYNHIKLHVDRVRRGKGEPRPDLPGIDLLYERHGLNNAMVRTALDLWEHHNDISTEQALVRLVDSLVQSNEGYKQMALELMQTSTRPVIITGDATNKGGEP